MGIWMGMRRVFVVPRSGTREGSGRSNGEQANPIIFYTINHGCIGNRREKWILWDGGGGKVVYIRDCRNKTRAGALQEKSA